MSTVNLYAFRDAMWLDQQGGHYVRHVDHMTREGLHSKSDIAAELGWRDYQIAELTRQVSELQLSHDNIINSLGIKGDGPWSKLVIEYVMGLVAENEKLKATIAEINNELCGQGFEVSGWHLNGDLEPLDNWFTDNGWDAPETINTDAAIAEVSAKAVEEFASSVGAEAEGLSPSSKEYKSIKSTVFRAVKFAANLRTGRKG